MSLKDTLGDRIKSYENVTRNFLVPKSYAILRVDGKCFSKYTKNLIRPFDSGLIDDLDQTWLYLCDNIQNAKLGYGQSDEFTLILTDFEDIKTDQYFGGNIQKICSVVASMAAAKFNQLRTLRFIEDTNCDLRDYHFEDKRLQLAAFDCRVFNVPSKIEAYNSVYWRWKDCERNSISSVAYANFSHKEIEGKSNSQKQEMLMMQKGINWSKLEESLKNGRFFFQKQFEVKNTFQEQPEFIIRNKWVVEPGWKISENKQKLLDLIPDYPV